ncbi:MAG: 4Fe-4S binding protein [Firmicutes bacterium]|nr:4Fe-4S binding protein [Bacillota bacterium]
MKILLFYFSGAGYTRWAVNRLCGLLLQNGHSVHLEAVENCDMEAVLRREDKINWIGFAQPIYAADIPRIMRRAIGRFLAAAAAYPALPTKVFFLNTHAYVNGSGYLEAKKLFANSPFTIHAYVNVKMPNSACGKRPDTCPKTAVPGEAQAVSALAKLARLAKSMESGERCIDRPGPQAVGGKLVRRVLRSQIRDSYQRFRVDSARCTRCMHCVDTCPVRAIAYAEGQGFTFSAACEACMRCVHGCPARAISVV